MTTDTIHGIERNPDSPAFGELVVPVANLWRKPGITELDADDITGALPHLYDVELVRSKEVFGFTWCYVRVDVVHEGTTYPQRGWLRASLLKDAGAAEYE